MRRSAYRPMNGCAGRRMSRLSGAGLFVSIAHLVAASARCSFPLSAAAAAADAVQRDAVPRQGRSLLPA